MKNVYAFTDRETIEAEARKWLIRLDGDEPLSTSELEELRDWTDRSPAHRRELQRISAFWGDATILTELAVPLNSNANQRMVRGGIIGGLIARLFPFGRTGGVVTVCLLGLGIALLAWLGSGARPAGNGIYATAIGEMRSETLMDGSVIQINTDSQIQVDYSDDVRKLRLLRGEAHFEVRKDPDRPFEVYAGRGMVEAVGTAFAVRLNDGDIKVLVTEGRVDLASRMETAELPGNDNSDSERSSKPFHPARLAKVGSLERGQSATFGHSSTKALASASAAPVEAEIKVEVVSEHELVRRLAWRDGYLVFRGEPLAEVVSEVSRYTPVVIEIADPTLRNLKIGGRFKAGELEALCDALEASFGVQVSRLDDQHIQLRPAG